MQRLDSSNQQSAISSQQSALSSQHSVLSQTTFTAKDAKDAKLVFGT